MRTRYRNAALSFVAAASALNCDSLLGIVPGQKQEPDGAAMGGDVPKATDADASEDASCQSCNGACADLMSDPSNCGSCGHACSSDVKCLDGQCGDTIVDI